MRRLAALTCALVLAVALAPEGEGAGAAPSEPSGWDGANPFVCTLQMAGLGTAVPDPGADPYCVDFDKRHQNVDQLGVVDFLSNEPARVAAATPKCFYFQSDHWRGSVIQDNGATKTYEWDGHYFFDKARGDGGAWVTNFSINGHSGDPTTLPGMPQSWAQYFGPGTGGVITHNSVQADPGCAARAQAHPEQIYADPRHAHGTAPEAACMRPTGSVRAGALGPVSIRERVSRVQALLGPPHDVRRGFLRYCQTGAGKYLVGWAGRVDSPPGADPATAIVLTTNRAYRYAGLGRGSSARRLRRGFPRAHHLLRQGATDVWSLRSGVLAGVRHGRVRFIAVYDARAIATRAALANELARSQ